MEGGRVQHLDVARVAVLDGALGVGVAGAQRIAPAQLDRVEAEGLGHLVHHHLGDREDLDRAVAAHRTCRHRLGGDGGGGEVGLREVVDRLGRAGRDLGHGEGEVRLAPAVAVEHGLEDLEPAGGAIGDQGHVRRDRVALEAELELLVAVVGHADRQALAVERGGDGPEGEDRVVLGAVADGGAGQQLDALHRKGRVPRHHVGGDAGDLVGRLGGDEQAQGAAVAVVPGVAVVGLHRGGVDGLGEAAPLQHELGGVGAGRLDLGRDRLGSGHAAAHRLAVPLGHLGGVEVAAAAGLLGHAVGDEDLGGGLGRPGRGVAVEAAPDHRVLHRGEHRVAAGRVAGDAHVARGAVVRRQVRRGLGTVAHHLGAEAQRAPRRVEAVEVTVDQQRDRIAEVGRDLAPGDQEEVPEEPGAEIGRLGRTHSVALQIRVQEQAVGLEVGAEGREVHAVEGAVRPGRLDEDGVRLGLRPARQVAGAEVAGEDLLPRHLAQRVPAEARRAVGGEPGPGARPGMDLHRPRGRGLEQRHGDPGDGPELHEIASRQVRQRLAPPRVAQTSQGWAGRATDGR